METNQEWTTGTIEFSLAGEPVEMQMTVPANPVTLSRMLPIFQQMTDSFLEVGLNKARSEGKAVSCTKGCGACCRQLVPVSEAETILISQMVESFPEPRRSRVKKRFADACRHFYENKWFERIDHSENLTDDKDLQKLADDYFKEGVPCPFLEDESCSIHTRRPLACREYLVTSPAVNCVQPTVQNIDKVRLLFLLSDTILSIENKENAKPINFVPLIFSLAFAGQNSRSEAEKTGMEWMTEFFQELSNQCKTDGGI